MKINWYGHAAFSIVTEQGTKIIIDPYESGGYDGALAYGRIQEKADIVITSHDHADHNYTKDIQGAYRLINQAGAYEVKDVKLRLIPAFHDASAGKERGKNLISVMEADDLVVVHLGDLGHGLDAAALKNIGKMDILLMPVGGFFTIDAAEATQVMTAINPMVTIPMHYKTEKCGFPIAPVENFTGSRKNVRMLNQSEWAVQKATLPKEPEIIVLAHAL